MNLIKIGNVVVIGAVSIMLVAGILLTIRDVSVKREIVRICPDGTRIYQYSNGRFEAVGTGWGSITETVPGPGICDK